MFNANFHYQLFKIYRHPWRQPSLVHAQLPSSLKRPMQIKGSLTRFIESYSRQPMQVEIISESWARPLPYECRALNIGLRSVAWVREVVLLVNQQQWVYARSVIPRQALRGDWTLLQQLRQRPLGSLLFQRQKSDRGVIHIAKLPLPCVDQRIKQHSHQVVWMRYSTFSKTYRLYQQRKKTMLVSEYFLNDFMHETKT